MSKQSLTTLVIVLALFGAFEMFVARTYEYHNDKLTFALGQCIGINKMRRR